MSYANEKREFAQGLFAVLFDCEPTEVAISVEDKEDPIVITGTCLYYPSETLEFPSNDKINAYLKTSGATSVKEALAQIFNDFATANDNDGSFAAYSF